MPLLLWSKAGVGKLFCTKQMVNILGIVGHMATVTAQPQSLSQPFNSAVIAQKQSQAIHRGEDCVWIKLYLQK